MTDARVDLAHALSGLESKCKAGHLDAAVAAVQALARLWEENAAELAAWRGQANRLMKTCDVLVGRVAALEARWAAEMEGDGR